MKFNYEALNSQSDEVKGEVEAEDMTSAINQVRDLDYFPTKVKAVTEEPVEEEKEPTQEEPVSENRQKLLALMAAIQSKVEGEKASEMEKLGLEAFQLILKYEEPLNESIKIYGKAFAQWLMERQKNKPINKIQRDLEEIKNSLKEQGEMFSKFLKSILEEQK